MATDDLVDTEGVGEYKRVGWGLMGYTTGGDDLIQQ